MRKLSHLCNRISNIFQIEGYNSINHINCQSSNQFQEKCTKFNEKYWKTLVILLFTKTRISGPFHSSSFRGIWGPSAPNWGPSAPTWGPAAPIWGPAARDHDGDGSTMSQTTYVLKFSFLHWIKRCKEPSCPRSPGLGFGVYQFPNYLCSKIQLSTLNKKVQRTLTSLKSWTGVVQDSGGSWLGFWSWSQWKRVTPYLTIS